MKKTVFGLLVPLFAVVITPLFVSAAPDLNSVMDSVKSKYTFDGPIYDSVTDGETLYIGGGFTTITETAGFAMEFNALTGERIDSFPKVQGGSGVYTSVSDGDGGWYIGGSFTTVGDEVRDNLAHVLSDGTVDENLSPEFDGVVETLALSSDGQTLYVGGEFTCIGIYDEDLGECLGDGRHSLAAFDTTTGELTDFDAGIDDSVYTLALSQDDNTLYVGGQFTLVNLEESCGVDNDPNTVYDRSEYDPLLDTFGPETTITLGSLQDWMDVIAGESGGYLERPPVVEGSESGGLKSNPVGQFLFATEQCNQASSPSNPKQGNPEVPADVCVESTLTGKFYNLNVTSWEVGSISCGATGTTRNNLAAFDTTTGLATAFDPNVSGGLVRALLLSSDGETVYAGGDFTSVNGATTRNYIAAFDSADGVATAFDPDSNGSVQALDISSDDSLLYAGGSFTFIGGAWRTQFAVIDTNTGGATAFDADIQTGGDDTVYTVAVSADGGMIYIGGDNSFTDVGGQPRTYFAAIDADTALATVFDPGFDGNVETLSYSAQDELFVGGMFTGSIDTLRSEVAAIDLATYELTDFDPDVVPHNENTTYALELSSDGNILYVGGSIDGVNGGDATRAYLAAVTTSDGLATDFDPSLSGSAYTLELSPDDSTLYVGGSFTTVNSGTTRNYLAAFDTTDGSVTAFDTGNTFGNVVSGLTISSDGSVVYAGDSEGTIRNLDAQTGEVLGFSQKAAGAIKALALSPDESFLYVGGTISSVGFDVGEGLIFDEVTGELQDFPRVEGSHGDTVYASVSDGAGGWYLAGDILVAGDIETYGLVHVLSDGTVDENFLPVISGGSGYARALALSPGGDILYVGGAFGTINDQPVYGLGALDTTDGSPVAGVDFNDSAIFRLNPFVLTLSSDGETLYVGSLSTEFGSGDGFDALFAFDTSDGSQLPFDPDVNDTVKAMVLFEDETLYIGGEFTDVNEGTTRNHLAAIDTATGLATNFDPNVNGNVYSLFLTGDGSVLYAGGDIVSVGGEQRIQLAAIDTGTGLPTLFDADLSGGVETVYAIGLSQDESVVYIGGDTFEFVGDEPREFFAAIDTATALATDLDLSLDGPVYTISSSGDGDVFVGGTFLRSQITTVAGLVSFDIAENTLTDDLPQVFSEGSRGTVEDMVLSSDGNILYIGGYFDCVGAYDSFEGECLGDERSDMAAINTGDGSVDAFDPVSLSDVLSLTLSPDDGELYASDYVNSAFAVFDSDEVDEETPPAEEEESGGGGSSRRHGVVPSGISSNEEAVQKILEQLILVLQQLIAQLSGQQQ